MKGITARRALRLFIQAELAGLVMNVAGLLLNSNIWLLIIGTMMMIAGCGYLFLAAGLRVIERMPPPEPERSPPTIETQETEGTA